MLHVARQRSPPLHSFAVLWHFFTSATSTPSSVSPFVLPFLIAVDHSNGADIQRGQPTPLGVTFSNALSKLKAQSLNVSFY